MEMRVNSRIGKQGGRREVETEPEDRLLDSCRGVGVRVNGGLDEEASVSSVTFTAFIFSGFDVIHDTVLSKLSHFNGEQILLAVRGVNSDGLRTMVDRFPGHHKS